MKLLGIEPTGQQIFPKTGDRNILKSENIREALLSVMRNQGFEKARSQAEEVTLILDKVIYEWTESN